MPGGRSHAAVRRTGKPGRPSALSEETVQIIEHELLALASYDEAAAAAFIDPTTFERWRKKGKKDLEAGKESDYAAFYRRVLEANSRIKRVLRTRVMTSRDPKMALKILERRWPEEWGLRVKVETAAPKASPRKKVEDRLSAIEERMTQAQALRTAAGEAVASDS